MLILIVKKFKITKTYCIPVFGIYTQIINITDSKLSQQIKTKLYH